MVRDIGFVLEGIGQKEERRKRENRGTRNVLAACIENDESEIMKGMLSNHGSHSRNS